MKVNEPFNAADPPFTRPQTSSAFVLSGSLSLVATVDANTSSSAMVYPSLRACGGSFTGPTLIVATARAHADRGSQSS